MIEDKKLHDQRKGEAGRFNLVVVCYQLLVAGTQVRVDAKSLANSLYMRETKYFAPVLFQRNPQRSQVVVNKCFKDKRTEKYNNNLSQYQ